MFTLKKKPLNCASIERFLRLHHFLFNNVFFLPNLGDLGMIINLACEIWILGSAAFVRGAFRMPLLSYHWNWGKIVDQINDSSTKNFCRENQFEGGVFVINQKDQQGLKYRQPGYIINIMLVAQTLIQLPSASGTDET